MLTSVESSHAEASHDSVSSLSSLERSKKCPVGSSTALTWASELLSLRPEYSFSGAYLRSRDKSRPSLRIISDLPASKRAAKIGFLSVPSQSQIQMLNETGVVSNVLNALLAKKEAEWMEQKEKVEL